MLGMLAVQVSSGLFAEDDGLFYAGSLSDTVSSAAVLKATSIHNKVASMILVLVILHLGVMAYYYFWKKENLVIAMLTGKKLVRRKTTLN